MDRANFLRLSALGAAGLCMPGRRTPGQGTDRPNIVLILADDLGWNDVGYHGGAPKTPNIDALAAGGLQMDRFYACPICTPTRASLLTGRYSIRDGLMRAVIPPWRKYGLPPEEETIAEMLAHGPYRHRACLGKWHLGHADRKYHPLNQGFTYFHGCYNGAVDYFTHKRAGELDWHRNFSPSYEDGYITNILSNDAVRYIERYQQQEDPFFLYLPYTAPHRPNEVPERYLSRYPDLKGKEKTHAAMISALDDGVGNIRKALQATGIEEDTLVLFISDNGGALHDGASNLPLRGQKQEVFGGGVRVPAFVRWPGKIKPGKTGFDAPMSIIDIYPTLQSITGIADEQGEPVDGVDLSGVWQGRASSLERDLFMYWGQNGNQERLAMWRGRWKLVYNGPDIQRSSAGDADHIYLFDLKEDPDEKHNLAKNNAGKIPPMLGELQKFRKLRPKDGIPPYGVGSKGFKAPKEWNIDRYGE